MPTRPSSAPEPLRSSARGKPQKQTTHELDIHPVTLFKWVKQDRSDRGEISGTETTTESAELRAARRRIRELETELVTVRQAAKFLGEDRPKGERSE